jgi:hypothetical protein
MGISHERLLGEIEADFPQEIDKMKKYESIQPPVSKEYLYELCSGDEGLTEHLEEMLEYFYRYTHDACEQQSLISKGIEENLEEIREKDIPRTRLHDAMIDSVKILARNLGQKGKDISWFASIDKRARAGYAQLALSTTLLDILKRETTH